MPKSKSEQQRDAHRMMDEMAGRTFVRWSRDHRSGRGALTLWHWQVGDKTACGLTVPENGAPMPNANSIYPWQGLHKFFVEHQGFSLHPAHRAAYCSKCCIAELKEDGYPTQMHGTFMTSRLVVPALSTSSLKKSL